MSTRELIAWITVLEACFPRKRVGKLVWLIDKAKRHLKRLGKTRK